MSPLPLNLIRYLIVCRVNASMVWLSSDPAVEFSLVLGTFIQESLPTIQARPWRKALVPWKEHGGLSAIRNRSLKAIPGVAWPVEAVIFCYPGKRAYGEGELVMLELKLIGEGADHSFFLETVLPALETASSRIDRGWQTPNSLWGKFDINSVYVARGHNWETLVHDGRLDLRYSATSMQWCEGLDLRPHSSAPFQNLIWITPFNLRSGEEGSPAGKPGQKITPAEVPSLSEILTSLMTRMNSLPIGKPHKGATFWDVLAPRDRDAFQEALDRCSEVPMIHSALRPVSRARPGRWIGRQRFGVIPDSVVPYLGLASIFHIGEHTHLGCGTFTLS